MMFLSMSMEQTHAPKAKKSTPTASTKTAKTATAQKTGNRFFNGGKGSDPSAPFAKSGGGAVKAAAVKGSTSNGKGTGLRRRRRKTQTPKKKGAKLGKKKIFKGVATKGIP
jgi:hypothetical protein